MSTAVRTFFFWDDGRVEEVPRAVFDGVRAGTVPASRYAAPSVRYALVIVDEGGGGEVELTPLWCGALHFDASGYRDPEMTARQHRLSVGLLHRAMGGAAPSWPPNVLDAQSRLARRWIANRFSWAPTEAELERLRVVVRGSRIP